MKIKIKWLEKKCACSGAREEFETRKLKSVDSKKLCTLLIKENKLDWCNWLISRLLTKTDCIRYAIYAAEQVVDIFEKKYPDDKRPREAIDAAKRYVKNPSKKNKDAAYAVCAAVYAVSFASFCAAAYAVACAVAYAVACAAARAVAYAVAYAVACAVARAVARAVAYAVACAAARAVDAAAAADAADSTMKIKILKYGMRLIKDSQPVK
jgi:hypothetical protein